MYLLLAEIKATFRGDLHRYSSFKDEDTEAQRNNSSCLQSASSRREARNQVQAHTSNRSSQYTVAVDKNSLQYNIQWFSVHKNLMTTIHLSGHNQLKWEINMIMLPKGDYRLDRWFTSSDNLLMYQYRTQKKLDQIRKRNFTWLEYSILTVLLRSRRCFSRAHFSLCTHEKISEVPIL